MKTAKLYKTTRSMVLLGRFQPSLFHPLVLAERSIAPLKVAESLKIVGILQDVSDLRSDDMEILVFPNRFAITTHLGSCFETIKDMVCNTLQVFDSFKVEKFGINTSNLYEITDKRYLDQIGDCLAPKDIWSEFFPQAGLVEMQVCSTRGEISSERKLTSVVVRGRENINNNLGLEIALNHHRNLQKDEDIVGSVQQDWVSCEAFEKEFFSKFLGKFEVKP